MRTSRGYSELVMARELTIIYIWRRLKGRQGSGRVLSWKDWKVSGMHWLDVVGMERKHGGNLCYWFGEHFCLSVIDPELEVWAKIREASSYWPSTDQFGPISAEVVVWPSGLIAAEVVYQCSIFIYDLAIDHLHTQSQGKH